VAAGAERVPGTEALGAAAGEGAGVHLSTPDPDVRVLRRLRGRDTVFLVSNEGEDVVRGGGTFPATGRPQVLDPDDGSVRDAPVWRHDGHGTWVDFALEPYEVAVIAFRDRPPPGAHLTASPLTVEAFDGGTATVVAERPGRWTLEGTDGRRRLTGTVTVTDPLEPIALEGGPGFEVDLSAADLAPGRRLILDLGAVRDVAEVSVNGRDAGRLPWRPYRLDVTDLLRAGPNSIAVRVTSALEGTPALLGPVALRPQRVVDVRMDHRREDHR
jgi:hypothetical protein